MQDKEHDTITSEDVGKQYEFNSYWGRGVYESLFGSGVYDYFSKAEIESVLRDPIANHEAAIRLSEFAYAKNGIVRNSLDYRNSMMTLDRVVITPKSKNKRRSAANKELMISMLNTIDDKSFMRDALFTDDLDGIAFYYFEVKKRAVDRTKFLSDYEVENIYEINELGINASIITLPWEYTKIVGKKNNRYVLAFNLQYFDDFTGEELSRKLRKYPQEIVDGYNKKNRKQWLILDNDKTMCVKVGCKDSEPWGRSSVLSALSDILYKDYFTDVKRNVLDEVANRVIYQVFPENKQGSGSTLNRSQQENQHNTVKQAIINKNNRGGVSFISLAAGTKLDSVNTSTDIFDEKNETNLNSDIAVDLGVSASLIGAMTTGTYAGGVHNVELLTSQLYSWICKWKNELVHVINKNIIKDKNNPVDIYYFPTSFVNRKDFFDMMSTLYTQAGGSRIMLVASSGVSPEAYFSVLDYEIENSYAERYPPNQTSYTLSSKDNTGGRPKDESTTNENTIKSRTNNGNNQPKPSTN